MVFYGYGVLQHFAACVLGSTFRKVNGHDYDKV